MINAYVHGYGAREQDRLQDQAGTLEALLHSGTSYPAGSRVLEAAAQRVERAGITNVTLQQADLFALPFRAESFDHVFLCFVLEHLPRPAEVLAALSRMVRRGGTVTAIEGDHGSTYFHPEDPAAKAVIECQIALQKRAGGNALIGRQLYPLMKEAGLDEVRVEPRTVYVDGSRPGLAEGFTRKTFTAMIAGVRESAIAAGLIAPAAFDVGIRALQRAAAPDGVFCYTFFKGVGVKR